MKGWRTIVGALAFVTVIASVRPAGAAVLDDAGWGMLTVLTNVVYMPVKLVYATLGGLTGACALGLTGGDMQTAESVWVTSMGGTYVVTPGMLRGEETLAFRTSSGQLVIACRRRREKRIRVFHDLRDPVLKLFERARASVRRNVTMAVVGRHPVEAPLERANDAIGSDRCEPPLPAMKQCLQHQPTMLYSLADAIERSHQPEHEELEEDEPAKAGQVRRWSYARTLVAL